MTNLMQPIEAAMALASDPSTRLGLSFDGTDIKPGEFVSKGDAKSAPTLSFDRATGTYIVLCIDLDAPFPSWAFLGPILHWNQPGLKLVSSGNKTATLSASEPFISNYAGPGPPPCSTPHRYVFLLYEQPKSLVSAKYAPEGGKEMGMKPRIKYDLAAFVKQAGLGPVVACNYFVSN